MKISLNLSQIKLRTKDFLINLAFRLKPRLEFRWLLTLVLWLIFLTYLGLGIYFGREIYLRHS